MNAALDSLTQNRWILEVFAVVFAALLADFFQRRLLRKLEQQAERYTQTPWDEVFIRALTRPLSLLIWVVGVAFAAQIAVERTNVDSLLFSALTPLRDIGVIVALVWFILRLTRITQETYIARRIARGEPVDRSTVEAISKLLRLSISITGVLVMMQTLGYSISGVLAFGGVGGVAIGFAARDFVANLFGGLMIHLDRPFAVGDWIRSPDKEIEGSVERIGWRMTQIRTFDKRPLYVPNAVFSTISVENPQRMTNRRIKETIGIRYDDLDKMEAIVRDVRAMLESHPEIDSSTTLIINFLAFADSSLNFLVYAFTRTTEWIRYHQVKQDVLLKIAAIIAAHGAQIAFPTRTLDLPEQTPWTGGAQGDRPPVADAAA